MSAERLILSAALVLRRDEDDERIFLVRRGKSMRFFGGVYAFVGGKVDAVDRRLGGRDLHAILQSALAREVCEELAVDLCAPDPSQSRVDEAVRRALIEDSTRWQDHASSSIVSSLGAPVLRLVTPEFYPRRFDTWFFLATLGDRALPILLADELDEADWDTPRGWLSRFANGDILLVPPAVLMLAAMDGVPWSETAAIFERLQSEVEGPAIQPIFISPAVQLIPLRTPTLPPAAHTNAYLIGHQACYLVDPATPHESEQAALALTLERAAREGREVQAILLTHHHPDHVGAVEFARERYGWPVFAHHETAGRVDFAVDRQLEDGDRLELGPSPDGRDGWQLECHFTPGHAPGHLAFFERRYGSLIAGDMVSTRSSILVHPDDGDLAAYMASLGRLAELPVRVVYPAHGPSDAGGTRLLTAQIEHRLRRQSDVLGAVRAGCVEVEAITRAAYTDISVPMLGYASHSVRSILIQLDREGSIRFDGEHARPV